MKITFTINYHTHWGQKLYITGLASELGANDLSAALPLQHKGNGNWETPLWGYAKKVA